MSVYIYIYIVLHCIIFCIILYSILLYFRYTYIYIYIYNDYPPCSSTIFTTTKIMISLSPDVEPTAKELMLKAVGRHGQAFPGRRM